MFHKTPGQSRCRLVPHLARLMLVATPLGLIAASDPSTSWRASHHHELTLAANWRFHLGDIPGAEAPAFDDSSWQTVDVPHDWSIAGPRSPDAATGMGGGYAPSGIGWYRKTFTPPPTWKGQVAWVVFDGVYMNTQVWINGQSLGVQRYGYSSFHFDVAPFLKPGVPNVLVVRVDNSAQPNSRWYSGSGIYRDVRIEAADAVHISPNGVAVTTVSANPTAATLRIRTTVFNDTGRKRKVTVESHVLALPEGRTVLATGSSTVTLGAHESAAVIQRLTIPTPALWTPDTPALYQLVARAAEGERLVDAVTTRFGIRTVGVSVQRGFELNGEPIKLNGANVHHDHGPLGAASYRDAEYRRVRLLKAAGFNAVRTAHNPPAPAFLDACDELGLIVMDEAFDCWEKGKNPADYSVWFKDWWQRDLDAMILRDRNHPSVAMWSIGNEIQELGQPQGIALAKALAKRVRELDSSRLVSCGWTQPWMIPTGWTDLDPAFAELDLAGYNYKLALVEDDHARVPSRVMLGTESFPADTFAGWAAVQDHPYYVGDIVWTGWDYLGESGIGRVYPPGEKVFQHWETQNWPWYGAYCGDIDITGWRKPISHYRDIVWDRGEKLYVAVQEPTPTPGEWQPTMWGVPPTLDSWTWPGLEGKSLKVEVYSRHERVRLFLNDKLVGEKPTTRAEEFKAVFDVTYEPGKLRIVGLDDDKETETRTLETVGPAVGVRLRPDWNDDQLRITDPTFAIAEIVDAAGRWVPDSKAEINFSASEGAKVIAVGTGDLTTPESYVATSRRAWHGRALVIVRPGPAADGKRSLTITATVPELDGASSSLSGTASAATSP